LADFKKKKGWRTTERRDEEIRRSGCSTASRLKSTRLDRKEREQNNRSALSEHEERGRIQEKKKKNNQITGDGLK